MKPAGAARSNSRDGESLGLGGWSVRRYRACRRCPPVALEGFNECVCDAIAPACAASNLKRRYRPLVDNWMGDRNTVYITSARISRQGNRSARKHQRPLFQPAWRPFLEVDRL
jgi:hypothetical protein